jgi:hypothetical protein
MKTAHFTLTLALFKLSFFLFFTSASAQSLYKVPLEEKIQNSTLIVEGQVIGQKSFWNSTHTMIYTSNTLEVYKEFKGTAKTRVEVLTVGGRVGNKIIKVSDLLTLSPGQTGVFFLYPNSIRLHSPASNALLLDVYSSQQGFIGYDLSTLKASTAFTEYSSIVGELYPELRKKIGRSYIDKKPSFKIRTLAPAVFSQIASISSFTPVLVTAGTILDPTNNELTIDGSGFGTGSGSAAVLFDNADNAVGSTPYTLLWNDPLVISWTDTRIRLRVPTAAGTGTFQVRDALGNITTSPSALTVLYSVFSDLITDGVNFYPKEMRLADMNGSGGYTIQYNTNIAGTPSQTTFRRALDSWKEICGANIIEGSNTAVTAAADDNMNIVMLDNASTGHPLLPNGVLGVCYTYADLCPTATLADQILIIGFDIVLRNPGVSLGATNFTLGPCPPTSSNFSDIDLETVVLHELGHALGLGHITDAHQFTGAAGGMNLGKVMNFQAANGSKRTSPDYAAKAGADYNITPKGVTFGACADEMVKLATTMESRDNCPGTFPSSALALNTSVTFDLNHATSNRYVDPNYTQVRCDAAGTDITTNAYYAFRTNSTGGIISIAVSGYNTTPAGQTSCTSAYGAGVLVTGVRLALYQVSSCPTAQFFPAPVACRTITANGALTDITGLAANTTYLMYLGGIENTKANFSLTFSGSSLLPINITNFHGTAMTDHNLLNWIIDYAYNVKSIHIERSANGINFEDIGTVTSSLADKKGAFKDVRPLTNGNYYRLATINMDGSKEYSKVILLTRNDQLLVNVFPNPARDFINVEINTERRGKFKIVLYNTAGQLLFDKQVNTTASSQLIRIPASKFAKGQYHIAVYDEQNKIVKNATVTVQ